MSATPSAVPSTPLPAGRTAMSAGVFDTLVAEFFAYLLRNTDESRVGREELYAKMELTGYDIGYKLALRMTRDRERMIKDLDVMKWICREFWNEVFRKSTDRLQTNSKGVYVIQDFNFRWTKYISGAVGEDQRALALKFLIFPCGLIRGALSALGMEVSVNVDVSQLPKVLFQINLKESAIPALPV